MEEKHKEFILYGLTKHNEIITEIIQDLNLFYCHYDIKLILMEALTNAFIHGNISNKDKPIYLRYKYYGNKIIFEIEDCGTGFKKIPPLDNLSNDSLLSENGRGLFLIKCFSDSLSLEGNKLIINKHLSI
ncbi:MAG: ATP-binding protein [Bacillota bacterium]|nr:ATP-binding protein [Bacillota bacterium]